MHTDILQQAFAWGERHYSQANSQKHAAFANSVLYALKRVSGGYGGPSVREHAVCRALAGQAFSDFDEACAFCVPLVYGPLTDLHRQIWDEEQEICFDDDPEDVRLLCAEEA